MDTTINKIRSMDSENHHIENMIKLQKMAFATDDINKIINTFLLSMQNDIIKGCALVQYRDTHHAYQITHAKGSLTNLIDKDIPPPPLKKEKVIYTSYSISDVVDGLFRDFLQQHNIQWILAIHMPDNSFRGFLFINYNPFNATLNDKEKQYIIDIFLAMTSSVQKYYTMASLKRINRELDKRVFQISTLFDLSKEFNHLIDEKQILHLFELALMGQFIQPFFLIERKNDVFNILVKNGVSRNPTKEECHDMFNRDTQIIIHKNSEKNNFLLSNNISSLIGLFYQNEKAAILGIGRNIYHNQNTPSEIQFIESLGNITLTSIRKSFLIGEQIEKKRLEEDLFIAHSIQKGLFPQTLPCFDNITLTATHIPSEQVGGDYYDIIPINEELLLFSIADVSGKGVPGSLIMANLQSMLRLCAKDTPFDMASSIYHINNILLKNTPSNYFITSFFGIYNLKNHVINYINAGHNPPLVLDKDGECVTWLHDSDIVLGVIQDTQYNVHKYAMPKNTSLILYTDGVTEAKKIDDTEFFGDENLLKSAKKNILKDSKHIAKDICNDALQFANNYLYDDMTLLVLTRNL